MLYFLSVARPTLSGRIHLHFAGPVERARLNKLGGQKRIRGRRRCKASHFGMIVKKVVDFVVVVVREVRVDRSECLSS